MAGSDVQSAPSEPIFGKKFLSKLGGMANESAASNVSDFARRQMEKMGWKEGKGLGKEEQGVVTHVRVKKREESMGIGVEKLKVEEQKNQWWYNAYDKIADKIKIAADSDDDDGDKDSRSKKKSKKKASKKKRKRDAKSDAVDADEVARDKKFRIPTDEELFAATGGKLFGRRAYGSCNGKLKRDEMLQSGQFELKKTQRDAKDSSSNSSSGSEDGDDKKKKKKKSKEKKKKASKKEEEVVEEKSDSE